MPRRRGPPKPITRDYLERSALHYLERYAASAEQLRRVLMRRVERAARAGVSDLEEGCGLADAVVGRLVGKGLVNDSEFALAKARSLHRRGRSRAVVARTLAAKGVDRESIARALDALAEDSADPELEAALAFARRRRIGPFRAAQDRAASRARDLATLGRGGFSFEIARRILDAESPEEIAGELHDRSS